MNKSFCFSEMLPIIEEQLDSGGSAVFAIHGTSMKPMMKDRIDSVRIIKPTEIKKYDIIFYRRDDGTFVLHRVVGIKDGGFVCRGDNQIIDEFPVKPESVIGIVTDYTKKGEWVKFGSSRQTFYSRFWVNTVIFRKIKRKAFLFAHNIKKKFKGSQK